jgi:hypothetical protein
MKFTETRTTMQGFTGTQTADYQMQYMASEAKDILNNLNNQFVEYLITDISDISFSFNLKLWLGNKYYNPSNENAKECLEICPTVKHLYGRKIKGWTDNALKCFDNFLLKYIQEDRKEMIKKRGIDAKERDVYWHLIELGGELQEIGQAFDLIYQTRNEFQHVQIIDQGGNLIPKSISNSKCNQKRDSIVGWFRDALVRLIQNLK